MQPTADCSPLHRSSERHSGPWTFATDGTAILDDAKKSASFGSARVTVNQSSKWKKKNGLNLHVWNPVHTHVKMPLPCTLQAWCTNQMSPHSVNKKSFHTEIIPKKFLHD